MAMLTTSFETMLQKAVLERLREVVEEEVKFAQDRITKRIKEAAPSIACTVLKRFSVTPYHDHLEIRVELNDKTAGP